MERAVSSLFVDAKDIVAYVADMDKMGKSKGCLKSGGMTEAQRLRARADEMEALDALIDRARELLVWMKDP